MTLSKINSLQMWHDYYVNNALSPDDISWESEEHITDEERDCIKDSIAVFQFGEYSEGRGLMKFAQAYARNFDDDYLIRITRLFVGEEQNHALLLRRFMNIHGLALIQSNWTDTIFRSLRKKAGYEWSITVLIVAEIIALIYYKALRDCTNSKVLKGICDKILRDETEHVKYQSELINSIRNSNPVFFKWAAIFLHRFLFAGTVIVVYFAHRKVLRKGGYDISRFWTGCWLEFNKCFASDHPIEVASARGV